MLTYKDEFAAKNYLNFLNSEDGQIQQELLLKYIKQVINAKINNILDAGCGSGWLIKKLKNDYPQIYGCDYSTNLVNIAKKENPDIDITISDILEELPYENNFFDTIILNMVIQDTNNPKKVFENIYKKLKNAGEIIITIPNPKYTYPVAIWKRGIIGKLLNAKPKLIIKKDSNKIFETEREFGSAKIKSFSYPIDYYLNIANTLNLKLIDLKDIKSNTDSNKFNLNYQLFRYPLLTLIKFQK
jgi:2-polyprenyl-3-methyl-5-hydroxy-6-metoxy-1,4-benzoquinol methylase